MAVPNKDGSWRRPLLLKGLNPPVNVLRSEANQPMDLEMGNSPLSDPGVEGRGLDPKLLGEVLNG